MHRKKLFLDNLTEIIDLANRTQKDEYVDLDALKGKILVHFCKSEIFSFIFNAEQSVRRSEYFLLYVGDETSGGDELQSDDPNL